MTDWNTITTRISTQPPAVDFIENRLPKQLPAFQNHNLQYDRGSDSWVPMSGALGNTVPAPADLISNNPKGQVHPRPRPPNDSNAMAFWSSIFGEAMARFTNKFPERIEDEDYNIRCRHDWAEVSAQLDAARSFYLKQYEAKDEMNEKRSRIKKEKAGIKAKFTKLRRTAADNIPPVIEALKFVPDVDYAKPVLGVVNVLLRAVQVSADTREQVVHGFDVLDDMFAEIELFLETFPDDYKIRTSSIDLIASTFNSVELAIKFFTSNISERMSDAVFSGEQYQQDLRDSLSNMKICGQQLLRDAQSSNIHHNKHALDIILDDRECQQTMVKSMHSLLNEYSRSQEENRHLRAKLDRIQSRAASPAPTIMYFTSTDDLLNFINIPNLEKEDMQRISEKIKLLNPEQKMRAENVVQTQRFKKWVVSTSPQILLIHGNFREGNQKVSALSLFCTTLIAALQTDKRFLPLVFFCGSHLDDDPGAGGLLMITSLVVQLLSQQDFDMQRFPRELYDDLQRWGNIAALCSLFKWLLYQLPSDMTVFCLIDGAVYYERDQFVDGMSEVLAKILDMATDDSLPVTAKVLVTSPTPTTLVRLPFDVSDSLLSVAAMSSRGWGPSQLRLEREMGEELNDL